MPDTDHPVAILGFGRFGRALAERIAESDLSARAFDSGRAGLRPASSLQARSVSDGSSDGTGFQPVGPEVPGVEITGSLAELTAGAQLVILATPVAAARDALTELRPHLTPDHLVIDVASVKAGPVTAMTDILGTDIPWIATHPLFGPSSIARAEKLRAVVCPNDLHPGATARATDFYERLGCDVTHQSGDEHDRTMAYTHALAFFVAKAMLDIGAGQDDAPAPPSFNAMAQTIDTVRADAGHLFYAIQHDNPHAAEARRALLDALGSLDQRVAEHAPDSGGAGLRPAASGGARLRPAESEPLAIAPGVDEPDVTRTDDLLREIDQQIAELQARRKQIEERAARFDPDA